jgi:hypothetical protein
VLRGRHKSRGDEGRPGGVECQYKWLGSLESRTLEELDMTGILY